MELKSPIALYICAGIAVICLIAVFITFGMKRKYNGGKKAYLPEYLKKHAVFRTRLVWYNILKYVLIFLIITSIVLSGFLMARPYKTESKQLANYNRDIILCLDISSSVDNLNATLIDKLEEIVKELNGERFGIVIFNTSPCLLCPLTNDYQYIIRELEKLKDFLSIRLDVDNGRLIPPPNYAEARAYLENGTLVGWPDRGSSIIGEGLAGAVLDFYDVEEKPDRTRIIIFTSDNDNAIKEGEEEIVTLPEAGEWAKERNITVFGIGTEMMLDADRKMMKETVENTGGTFWYGEDKDVVDDIVANLRKQMATLDDTQYEIIENEIPEATFRMLLLSIALMLLCAFILKV